MRTLFRNFFIALFFCGLASLLMLARFDYPLTGIDDANIYFVYAKNLANGHGFVYNVGRERVEGFTSILWTLISAVTFKLSSHPELLLLIVNIVIVSIGIAVALTCLQQGFGDSARSGPASLIGSLLFLILLLTSPRYVVWNTITLMENGLWSTLLLVTSIFVIQDHSSPRTMNLGFIPLSILLVLTRPESLLWGSLFLGILYLRRAFAKGAMIAFKELAPSILCFTLSVAAIIAFQYLYFGYPLPNTYYAKVSPSLLYNIQQGAGYLFKYLISDPIVLLSVLAIAVSGLWTITEIASKRFPRDGAAFLPLIAAVGLLEPLITGGDHFGSFRVYQNIYPIEIICLLSALSNLLPRFIRHRQTTRASQVNQKVFRFGSGVLLVLVFFPSQLYMWNSVKSEISVEFEMADYGRKNGAFIQGLFSPLPALPRLGVVTSGGIKYAYDGEVVDLMGLNNTLMAHNHGDRKGIKNHAAFDIPTFYKLQPDILWPRTVIEQNWHYAESDIRESWENREGLKGLFDQPRFLERYAYAKVSSPAQPGYALVAWFKKDLLDQLRSNPNYHIETYPYPANL